MIYDFDTTPETKALLESRKGEITRFGDVEVDVELHQLQSPNPETAKSLSETLARESDTLLVIVQARSEEIEKSEASYFTARPQVPLITTEASDDDLLTSACPQSGGIKASEEAGCYDGYWHDSVEKHDVPFAPLLQISPTNQVQANSAVQFAKDRTKRRFVVVLGEDEHNGPYVRKMATAYSNACASLHVSSVLGPIKVTHLDSGRFTNAKPDCVLYAGGVGEAQTLFTELKKIKMTGPPLMVIFSDAVVQTRTRGEDLEAFKFDIPLQPLQPLGKTPIATNSAVFTYQDDAQDYDNHKTPFVEDAFEIAQQLIEDLDHEGGDTLLRAKSILNLQTSNDVRRNLDRMIRRKFNERTWFASGAKGKNPSPIVFDGNQRYGGIFHVWQFEPNDPKPGMRDVDNWHVPQSPHGM